MCETPVAIRIDIDSARDIALAPELLDLFRLLDIKGTFFVTTGPDRLALNLFKHVANPQSYLKFIKSKPFEYTQFGDEFVPWLSIIDVMMFNSLDSIQSCVTTNYELN